MGRVGILTVGAFCKGEMVKGRALMFLKSRDMKRLVIFSVFVSLFCFSDCEGVVSGEKPLFMNPPEYVGVSDPDGQQTADGLIRIVYDYNQTTDRHIFMVTFREEDVQAGKAVTDAMKLRQLVSETSGGVAPKSEK